MATKRLTDYDRTGIINHLKTVVARTIQHTPFPIPLEDKAATAEFVRSITDPTVQGLIDQLTHRLGPHISMTLETYPWVKFRVDEFETCLRTDGTLTRLDTAFRKVHPDNPEYTQVSQWTREQFESVARANRVGILVYDVVTSSSSAGQLIRVFPFLPIFLPKKIGASLSEAIRKSRWPESIPLDANVDEVHEALALGSILEDASYGTATRVPTVERIEEAPVAGG